MVKYNPDGNDILFVCFYECRAGSTRNDKQKDTVDSGNASELNGKCGATYKYTYIYYCMTTANVIYLHL